MRKYFVTLTYCFIINICAAQKTDNDSLAFFSQLKTIVLPVSEIENKVPFKFKNVTVLDNRTDTARLGVFKNSASKNCQLMINQSLKNLFSSALTNNTSNDSLLIIIRNLSLINNSAKMNNIFEDYKVDKSSQAIFNSEINNGKIIFDAKVYIQHSSYYIPLLKIDTFFSSKKNVEYACKDLLSDILSYVSNATASALQNINYTKRIHLTQKMFDSINKTIYPVDTQKASCDSGIFLTYNDFLQHKVTSFDFSLKKAGDECFLVYEKQKDGTEVFTHSIWGLYYNKEYYIMNDGIIFKLYKAGNSFYWNGIFRYKETGTSLPLYAPMGGGSYAYGMTRINTEIKIIYTPYLLNMLTGKAF